MADEGDAPEDVCLIEVDPNEEQEDSRQQQQLSQGENSESNSTCMICMEEWTIGSAHRVCCLKCGHLFGRSCIDRWIREKGQQAKCPTCNKPARRVDLRDLWCKTIKAYDSTELADLQKQLEQERTNCAKERALSFHLKNVNDQLYCDIDKLKKTVMERDARLAKLEDIISKINKLRSEKLSIDELYNTEPENMVIEINHHPPQELKGKFYFAQNVESDPRGLCKSMTLCPTSAELLIAQPLPQGHPRLGNDFGIRKYSLLDTTVHSFICLHNQPLNSVQIKPHGDLILTSGQDRKVHLTSINNSRKVQTFDCQYEPLCVSWSVHRDQQFYVASRNCYIALYDMRNTSDYIYKKNERVAKTTMVSMTSVYQSNGLSGVVANDARGSHFLELSESSDYESEMIDHEVEHLKSYQLPFSGLMGTVDYHKPTNTTLITTRRSPIDEKTKHSLIKLKRVELDDGTVRIDCDNIRTFKGGRAPDLLGQSRIMRHPTLDDQVLVGSCDESAQGVKLWDASDNTEYQKLRTKEFIRDMVLYTPDNTNQHILYTLHDKGFGTYRWDYA
uniref:RING-type E3 ubiquitin transferase n=1 Tax=Aceria tosichella TaxID=561515 RepID=A0A6G1SN24_9ACAR